jgi:hypothetical protein
MRIGKMRRSAFADTRLGLLLRTNDVRHVTVAGADAVHGSLAATIFDALDADYAVTIAVDSCSDAGWTELKRTGINGRGSRHRCPVAIPSQPASEFIRMFRGRSPAVDASVTSS